MDFYDGTEFESFYFNQWYYMPGLANLFCRVNKELGIWTDGTDFFV